ncbi:hypothetical protein GGR98_000183 [Parageobacillus caldoxylosilyticus]|nr:hypothetical protein [Parageobacillus caldoxylosilyticus]
MEKVSQDDYWDTFPFSSYFVNFLLPHLLPLL